MAITFYLFFYYKGGLSYLQSIYAAFKPLHNEIDQLEPVPSGKSRPGFLAIFRKMASFWQFFDSQMAIFRRVR